MSWQAPRSRAIRHGLEDLHSRVHCSPSTPHLRSCRTLLLTGLCVCQPQARSADQADHLAPCHRGDLWPLSLQATAESPPVRGHRKHPRRVFQLGAASRWPGARSSAPRSAPAQYYAECHGVIYVIDSTDEERLSESKRAFEKMVTSEALDGVPILVLANKQDIETCLSIPDIKTVFSDCASKIGRRDCLTQACSALTGKGVREGIEWMVKCVVRNVHRPPRQRDIT
ncbi:ADP-ribosylation factor-related protein 1 isoform 1-T1 [Megaptera novaeangliae]